MAWSRLQPVSPETQAIGIVNASSPSSFTAAGPWHPKTSTIPSLQQTDKQYNKTRRNVIAATKRVCLTHRHLNSSAKTRTWARLSLQPCSIY